MRLIGKILASIMVLVTGALLMAGSFWLNFRNFKIDLNPVAQIQTESGLGGDEKTIPGSVGDGITNKDPENSLGTAAVAAQKKAVGGTAVPEKLESAPEKISVTAVQGLATVSDTATSQYILTRQGIVDETNRQRQANLGPGYELAGDSLLDRAAQAKVDDMFAGKYFEHTSPQGHDAAYFIGSAGYEYVAIGENLAMGNYKSDEALVQAWMDSPGHRENILKKGFKEIGVAAGYGNMDGRMVWLAVQEFGTPESACPAVDERLSTKIDGEKMLLDDYAKKQETYSADIEMKKDVINILEDDLSELASSSNSYSKIRESQDELNEAIGEVNSLVDQYNASVAQAKDLYEQYKADVEEYNLQVNAYNACIGTI